MESKKDIGKAFRDKLDLLDKQPGDAVWDSIRADLNKGRKKAIPVWLLSWLIGGVFMLTAVFTYPLWENKVPHIYIKMPEQEKEQSTGGAIESANSNGITTGDNEKGSSINTVKSGTIQGTDSQPNLKSVAGSGTELTTGTTATSATEATGLKAINTIKYRTATAGKPSATQGTAAVSGNNNSHISITAPARIIGSTSTVAGNASATTKPASYSGNKGKITKEKLTATAADKGTKSRTKKDIAGTKEGRSNTKEDEDGDDTETGFIVPQSADYKNYRNNIGNEFVMGEIPQDSTDTPEERDSLKIADKLKLRTTGVEKVIKAPVTKITTDSGKNFYIFAFAAPTKYTLAENAGYIDASLQDKSTSSETSLAIGAYFGYNINEKLSLRVGAIRSKIELTSNSVSVSGPDFEGIEYNTGITNESIAGQMLQNPAETLSIRNNFEFIEVPVELTYHFYNSNNIGLGILGGFITRFTTDNTVYAANETGALAIGSVKSLKDVNNGLSLGGRLNYTIVPNLQLNVEPVFKYFFAKDSFIKQYTYSIQAGLQYNFNMFRKK